MVALFIIMRSTKGHPHGQPFPIIQKHYEFYLANKIFLSVSIVRSDNAHNRGCNAPFAHNSAHTGHKCHSRAWRRE